MAGGGQSAYGEPEPLPAGTVQPGLPVSAPNPTPPNPTQVMGTGVMGSNNPNVFNQAAQNTGLAAAGTIAGGMYNPDMLRNTNYQPYMNPFTSNVINRTMGDMNRSRNMALNDLGASATAARAFGGSRHGVAEAETNRNFFNQAGNMAAGLRNQGYQNAQNAAMFDIGNQMAANQNRLGAAAQLAGIGSQQFGMGQAANQGLMQQGALQQAMQQQVIDAGRSQYEGYTGAPGNSLQYPLAGLSAAPPVQTQTTTKSPGLFDFLSLGMGLL